MKVKKHFYLKRFDVSLLQLRFSVLIHILKYFDILQVYYNKININKHWRTTKLQKKTVQVK